MRYFIVSYKKQPVGESGESCRSKYDLSDACIECGTGAKLIGNLRVKGLSKIADDFFETLDGDYIISTRLYNLIRDIFSDFNLIQVVDSKNNHLDFYHFANGETLPRIKRESTGLVIDRQCQTCKRNGYFTHAEIGDLEKNIPTIIHPYILKYDKNDLEKYEPALLFNTWECFGLSNKMATDRYIARYARPLIIVSEKIKDVFDREKLNDIQYEQILIE